jgi:hypothetical protein
MEYKWVRNWNYVFYYIIMKIYVFVCTNMYSLIYFLCVIIMPQLFFYHELYTLTNYIETFEK